MHFFVKRICFFLFCVFISFSYGQTPFDFGVRGLNFVGQNSQYQPAFIPQEMGYNMMVGLSVGADVRSTWITFSNIYKALQSNAGGGKYLNLNALFEKKSPFSSGIFANADVNFFYTMPLSKKRFHRKFLSFSAANKYLLGVALNGNEIQFGKRGESESWFAAQADKKILTFANYIDLGVGYAQEWKKFDFGFRVHYLLGLQSFTDNTFVNLSSTDSLLKGDMRISFNKSNADMYQKKQIPPALGHGMSLDLGIRFWIKSRLRIEASVVDLGTILWFPSKNNTFNINLQNLQHRYIDANNGNALNSFGGYIDSLFKIYKTNGTQKAYLTNLFPTVSIGGYYDISPRFNVGLLAQFTIANFIPIPYVSAWVTYTSRRYNYEITANIGYRDRTFLNLGIGADYNWKLFQGFIIFDNIANFFFTNNARNINFRIGINYFFNKRSRVIFEEEHPNISCDDFIEEGMRIKKR